MKNHKLRNDCLFKNRNRSFTLLILLTTLDSTIQKHYVDKLIRSFFSKVIAKRKVGDSNQLAEIPEDSGWLGNNNTHGIFPFDDCSNAETTAP